MSLPAGDKDHVLLPVGYRQWALSFSGPLAVRLGYDRELLRAVSGRLDRAVLQDMRRSVKRKHGFASTLPFHGGVGTVVQRFRRARRTGTYPTSCGGRRMPCRLTIELSLS